LQAYFYTSYWFSYLIHQIKAVSIFFIISKLLNFIIEPVVWVAALLLIALITKNQVRRKRFLIAGFVALYLFSNCFILDEFMRKWETPAVYDTDIKVKYDAGIVLGGMIAYDHLLVRPQFDRAGDRLYQAVALWRSGKIKKILLNGGSGSILEDQVKEADILKAYLIKVGVPDSVILTESFSKNTHENALFAKRVLDSVAPHGRFLLITSAFHMPRALKCYQKCGITVDPYSVDRFSGPRKFVFDHLFIPDAGAMSGWNTLLHEWIGYIIYKISGYI
jgi:uncharacterized SAM-binding protein YcdF (DUF218 family)